MIKVLTIILLVLGCGPVTALSVNQAVELALKNNPDLLAKQETLAAAGESTKKSFYGFFPAAKLTGSYTYYDPTIPSGVDGVKLEDNAQAMELSVSQPLFTGGKVYLAWRIAKLKEDIATLDYQDACFSTVATAEDKFYTLTQSMDQDNINRKMLESARQSLEIAEVRSRSGELSDADLWQLRSKTSSREVSTIQSENLVQINHADLAAYLSSNVDFTVETGLFDDYMPVVDSLSATTAEMAKIMVDYALANNPQLKEAELTLELGKKGEKVAAATFLPTVSLVYSCTNEESYDVDNNWSPQNVAMLQASLPLFPLADTYHDWQKARRDLRSANYSLQSARTTVELSARRAWMQLLSSARQVKASQAAASYARLSYEQQQTRFAGGIISVTDLLDADVQLESAESQLSASHWNFLRAISSLKRVLGYQGDIIAFLSNKENL